MRDLRIGVVGRIVGGDTGVGRLVEVTDDSESSGGYLIVTRSDENWPPETFDSWAESIADVELYFDEVGWQVDWL